MIEPTTPVPDDFLPVQAVAVLYVLIALGITIVLVHRWVPVALGIPAFLVVSALLLLPFWPLFRRFYPRHTDA